MRAALVSFRIAFLAFVIGAVALAQPARAWGEGRGGYGGYQGWGGLYRPDYDVGWGPEYVLYRDAYGEAPAAVHVRHALVHRRHAVARPCAPRRHLRRHCVCH